MEEVDWAEFHFTVKDLPVIAPCLCLSLNLTKLDEEGVLDFYEHAIAALGDRLKYRSIGHGYRRVTPKELAIVPSWKGKMTKVRTGLQIYFKENRDGVGGASLRLFISVPPYFSPHPRMVATGWKKELDDIYQKHGDANVFLSAALYISVPVDHPLAANPDDMLAWVKDLKLVANGAFSSGTCGYGINYDGVSGGVQYEMMPRIETLCRENPMLEFQLSPGLMRLLRYDGETRRILHKVRRASWLTLISGEGVEQLGGIAVLTQRLGAGPASLHRLGNGAMLIQAGQQPLTRAQSEEEWRPYRQAAAAIRSIRMENLERGPCGVYDSWPQKWLEAFD